MPREAAEIAAERAERWRQRIAEYRLVFGTDAGKKVLADLRRRFHAETTTFVAGDATATAFHEGQRTALLHIEQMLGMSEEAIARLVAIQPEEDELG